MPDPGSAGHFLAGPAGQNGASGSLFLFIYSLIRSHVAPLIYNYVTLDNLGLLVFLTLLLKGRMATLYHYYTWPRGHLAKARVSDGDVKMPVSNAWDSCARG